MEPKQGSAMRNKFLTQASSRIEKVKAEYMKSHDNDDDDPFGKSVEIEANEEVEGT